MKRQNNPTDINRLRLLYLPNESTIGDQIGPRTIFESLVKEGKLSGLEVYSYLVEATKGNSIEQVWDRAIKIAKTFKPNVILIQHIGRFQLPSSILPTMKSLPSHPTICYHEADIYGRFFKPFSQSMKTIAAQTDLAFLVGTGNYAKRYLKYGTKQVEYCPSCVDTVRFGSKWKPTLQRKFDVIVIGNRIVSRLAPLNRVSWGRMQGSFERDELVRELGTTFGKRFALYGHGWDGFIGSRGPIHFSKQEEATRKAWLAVSWDHFHKVPCFFSNRLAISLISGVANLTNYHPEYESIFRNNEHLVWAYSVREMVEKAKELISREKEELIQLGQRGRCFATENLSTEVVYRSILERITKYRSIKDLDGFS